MGKLTSFLLMILGLVLIIQGVYGKQTSKEPESPVSNSAVLHHQSIVGGISLIALGLILYTIEKK